MMVLEVDEASSLEAMEYGLGCIAALRRGSFKEEGEVDELDGSAELRRFVCGDTYRNRESLLAYGEIRSHDEIG